MANEETPKTWGKAEETIEVADRTVGPFTEVIAEYRRRRNKALRRAGLRQDEPRSIMLAAAAGYNNTLMLLESLNGI